MKSEKEQANVRMVSDMVNNFSFSEKEFCNQFKNEHRTLQQTFTRLCVEWLKTCASDDYRFDGRNEDSHRVALDLMNGYQELTGSSCDDIYIPMV